MAYDIGPRIGIEGEKEYRQQIQQITSQQKTLATEMQKVTSAFDKNDQSMQNLTAQNQVLNKQVELQKKKLSELQKGLAAASEKYGENNKVTQGWQQSVNKATAQLNALERQLESNNDAIETANVAGAGYEDQIESINQQLELEKAKLGEATAAMENDSTAAKKNKTEKEKLRAEQKSLIKQTDLQKQKVALLEKQLNELTSAENRNERAIIEKRTELANARKGLSDYEKSLDSLSKNLDTASGKLKSFGEKSKSAGQALLPASVAATAASAASVKFASDYNESLNKVNVAFKGSAKSVEDWSKTTLDSYGIASGTALEMASLFGDMATSMDIPTKSASDMSMTLVGLAGDLASFKNIAIDEAETALKSIFTGETESLKNLGIVMTQTNLDAYALAKGFGKTTSEMTEAEKVQLRYAYVLDKTKNAQGDFANTSDQTANSLQTFQQSVIELATTFGQELLPVITPIIRLATELIKCFAKLPKPIKMVIAFIGLLVAAAAPLLLTIGQISLGLSSLMTALPKLSVHLASMSAFLSGTLVPAISGAASTVASFVAGIGALPIAIAAAVGAIVYFWNTNEAFRNSLITFDKWITDVFAKDWSESFGMFGDVMNSFLKSAEGWYKSVKTTFSGVIDFINNVFAGNWKDAWEGVVRIFKGVFGNIAMIAKAPINAIIGLVNSAVTAINTLIAGVNRIKFDIPFSGGRRFDVNIPLINKIPYLAKGGILSTGSAIVGEKGAELLSMINGKAQVTPLTSGAKQKALADVGGDSYYYVTIDAKNVKEFNDIIRITQTTQQTRRRF
mgnify:FL=1